jgi:hypothetical protein
MQGESPTVACCQGGYRKLSGGRNRGRTAEESSTYWLVCGGIEFHDGGIRLMAGTTVGRTLVNEEFRGE